MALSITSVCLVVFAIVCSSVVEQREQVLSLLPALAQVASFVTTHSLKECWQVAGSFAAVELSKVLLLFKLESVELL